MRLFFILFAELFFNHNNYIVDINQNVLSQNVNVLQFY